MINGINFLKSFFSILLVAALFVPTSNISAQGNPDHYHMWESGNNCDGYTWVCAEPWGSDDCGVDQIPEN
jgi:hypothetical protein